MQCVANLVVTRSAQSRVCASEDFRCLLRLGVMAECEAVLVRRLPRSGAPRSLTRAHVLQGSGGVRRVDS